MIRPPPSPPLFPYPPLSRSLPPVAPHPLRLCHRAVHRREAPAVGERIGRHIHDADEDGVIEIEGATPAERPAARRVSVAPEEATQLRRHALEARRHAGGARERRETTCRGRHQPPDPPS